MPAFWPESVENADDLFETDRLVLRRFTVADADNLVDLDADPDVMRFINGGNPTPRHVIADTLHESWADVIDGAEHGEVEYGLLRADWEQGQAR